MCLNAGTCRVHISLSYFSYFTLVFVASLNMETGLTNLLPGKRNVNQFTLAVEVVRDIHAVQIKYIVHCSAHVLCVVCEGSFTLPTEKNNGSTNFVAQCVLCIRSHHLITIKSYKS